MLLTTFIIRYITFQSFTHFFVINAIFVWTVLHIFSICIYRSFCALKLGGLCSIGNMLMIPRLSVIHGKFMYFPLSPGDHSSLEMTISLVPKSAKNWTACIMMSGPAHLLPDSPITPVNCTIPKVGPH